MRAVRVAVGGRQHRAARVARGLRPPDHRLAGVRERDLLAADADYREVNYFGFSRPLPQALLGAGAHRPRLRAATRCAWCATRPTRTTSTG